MHLCIDLQVLNNSLTTDEAQAQVAELTKAVSFSLLICCLFCIVLYCILRAGVQPTLDPYAEAFIAGPLR